MAPGRSIQVGDPQLSEGIYRYHPHRQGSLLLNEGLRVPEPCLLGPFKPSVLGWGLQFGSELPKWGPISFSMEVMEV